MAVGQDHPVAAVGFDHTVAELFLVEPRVEAAEGEEFVVGAALGDHAVLDGEDDVGVADRRQPVRDGDRGAVLDEGLERPLYDALTFRVERRGRLVENENRWVLEDYSRDRQPLAFSTGEPVAALADDGVVATISSSVAVGRP